MRTDWKHRAKVLESVVRDIYWMARRYADGRQTYAPSMYNDAINRALTLGITLSVDSTTSPPSFYAKELE